MKTKATTIQIKEETKKALFLEKNRLERKLGHILTYDDVIEYLLSQSSTPTPRKTIQELQGTLEKEAIGIYKQLREEYRKDDK